MEAMHVPNKHLDVMRVVMVGVPGLLLSIFQA